jgi:hypothetical protein
MPNHSCTLAATLSQIFPPSPARPRRGGAGKPVVDRRPQAFMRDRRNRDAGRILSVELGPRRAAVQATPASMVLPKVIPVFISR